MLSKGPETLLLLRSLHLVSRTPDIFTSVQTFSTLRAVRTRGVRAGTGRHVYRGAETPIEHQLSASKTLNQFLLVGVMGCYNMGGPALVDSDGLTLKQPRRLLHNNNKQTSRTATAQNDTEECRVGGSLNETTRH